jgi:hypothetical protein
MRKIYLKMDTYNTFHECDEGDEKHPRHSNTAVDPFMVPLLDLLAKKRPAWRYITSGLGDLGRDLRYYHKSFTIMDGDEELGQIWKTTHWRTGETKYAIDCQRLKTKRYRGNHTETKDVRKAAKVITENMFARTLHEVMTAERSSAVNKTLSAVYNPQRDFRNIRERLMPDIIEFVINNYDVFEMTGASTLADKQKFLETYHYDKSSRVAEGAVGKTSALVVERGNLFHVEYAPEEGSYHTFTLDTLPIKLKEAVAVLKLCGLGELVDDIGVRTKDKTFFVLNGVEA